jgi:phosphoribosylamine-glycine ligase
MITHNVLILGSGAREHALAKKISHSHLLGKLLVTTFELRIF